MNINDHELILINVYEKKRNMDLKNKRNLNIRPKRTNRDYIYYASKREKPMTQLKK